MGTSEDLILAVRVSDPADMQRQLDEAVTTARARAINERRRGILVRRFDYTTFSVELSDEVPFGVTREEACF
jgi:hypothetical protein